MLFFQIEGDLTSLLKDLDALRSLASSENDSDERFRRKKRIIKDLRAKVCST